MNKFIFMTSLMLTLLTGCASTLMGTPIGYRNNVGQPYGPQPYSQPQPFYNNGYGAQAYGQVGTPIYGFPAATINPHFGSRPACTNQADFDDVCAQAALMQSRPQVQPVVMNDGSTANPPAQQSGNQPQTGTPPDLTTRVNALEQEVGAQGAALEGVIRRTRR